MARLRNAFVPLLALAGVAMAISLHAASDTGSSSSNSNYNTTNASNYGSSGLTGSSSSQSDYSGPFSSRHSSGNSRYSNQRTDTDQQRDSKRRDAERNKNSNQPGTKNQKAGAEAGKPGQKQMATTKGKPAAKKGSTGGTGRAATNVEFKMKADPNSNLLLIESVGPSPTMNMMVAQGEKCATRVGFRNGRHSTFSVIDVSIKYDPQILKPRGIDDTGIADLLAEPALARVEKRKGIIAYHAKFAQPITQDLQTIFKLEWDTLMPAEHSPLAFVNTVDFPSRVLNDDANLLQAKGPDEAEIEVSEKAGLVDASITVLPDTETRQAISEEDDGIKSMQLANSISAGTAEGGVQLALRPRERSIPAGGEFLVDVVFSNPRRADIDTVDLFIRFDPNVLQVVDYDENNWITHGLNIFDGDYHEELPFDYHLKNAAYNGTGLIRYQMGFSSRVRIPSSGTIATIKFKAVDSAAAAEIAFDLDESSVERRTSVSFLGFNLIGVPGRRVESLTNAAVRVQ
jgi:hypothetical protein